MLSASAIHVPEAVLRLATACRAAGGRAWLVGGTVRDALLERLGKDLDVEVHGLDRAALGALLADLGRAKEVGRAFGVFKLTIGGEGGSPRVVVDVSLPRADSATDGSIAARGAPDLGLAEAVRRRDLTINALLMDPITGELVDLVGGVDDLRGGLLRAVDLPTFGQDPLRVLRVARFAATFGFEVDPPLLASCQDLDLRAVPGERVRMELDGLLLADDPARGLRVALDTGALGQVLPAVEPPPLQVMQRLPLGRALVGDAPRPLALGWAVLLHRATPLQATECLDRVRIFSATGYPLRGRVLHAVDAWPGAGGDFDDVRLRGLAEDGEVALVVATAWVVSGEEAAIGLLDRAKIMGIAHDPLPRLLLGRDLAAMGVAPGPTMGKLLEKVRQAQVLGEVTSREQAQALVGRLWSEGSRSSR